MDQGTVTAETDGSSSFRRQLQRQEEKWWLPVPRVPSGGLHDDIRKQLQHKRDCANQILKAAMAINSIVLTDMDVPDSYLESLPKVYFVLQFNAMLNQTQISNFFLATVSFPLEQRNKCIFHIKTQG